MVMNDWLIIAEIVLLISVIGALIYFGLINLEKYQYRKMLKKRKHTPYTTRRQKLKEYNKKYR